MDGQSTNGSAQDFHNLALEHGRSDYDQRHNFVTALIWEVSYYHGTSRAMRWIANGWTISPIITLSSGLPFTVTSGKDNNFDGLSNDRANLVGDPFLDPHRDRAAGDFAVVQHRGVRPESHRNRRHFGSQPARRSGVP